MDDSLEDLGIENLFDEPKEAQNQSRSGGIRRAAPAPDSDGASAEPQAKRPRTDATSPNRAVGREGAEGPPAVSVSVSGRRRSPNTRMLGNVTDAQLHALDRGELIELLRSAIQQHDDIKDPVHSAYEKKLAVIRAEQAADSSNG
ncbi:unnamed protein product [Vitrella brassicaformis CCMP3155]|uniref:Uncharacterized protein n=1 Tax=Vitrella brassicaformis (strain CCMP3155) TaxID=1169540 RepID=A0A0G4EBP1_VITBC|nr:unnamed protein product [Vitrella brassicaformis CCMP3155]|eukprot:CEL92717.1 unnamed protein product [Vitrella brassicaformis CCMP3155]